MNRVLQYPRRLIALLTVALCGATGAFTAHGQDDPQTILWAGMAFRGNASDITELLPVTKSVVDRVGIVKLNELAWERIQHIDRPDVRFSRELGSSTSGNAIALALALDFEQFGEAIITNGQERNVCGRNRLWAQILVFDFTDKKLIGAFPLSTYVQECQRNVSRFSEEKKVALAEELLFKDSQKSILAQFESNLLTQEFHTGWQANIKVTEVVLGKYTKEMLEQSAWSEAAYRRWLASTFAAAMSQQQRIPVLPYSLGDAIAGAMPLRFSDTNAYAIALPPANYAVKLTARGYVEKLLDETKRRVAKSFIFSLGVDFYDPDFGDHYFDENMTMFEKKEYAKEDSIDAVQIYEEITSVLVSQFLEQFPKPDKKWVAKHVKTKAKWKDLQKSLVAVDTEIFSNIRGD